MKNKDTIRKNTHIIPLKKIISCYIFAKLLNISFKFSIFSNKVDTTFIELNISSDLIQRFLSYNIL